MAVKLDCFFEALAERLSKENHLSDITYALCQSDKVFLQFFLDFFFGDDKINVYKDKVEISRELSFENGRPDFTIHVGESEIYIIEVKIWDSNHHFSQYKERLGDNVNGHLGYIANYTINKEELSKEDKQAFENACADGKTVKTWKEFIHKLERYQAFNDPMIRSYLDYVRAVCPFDDFSLSAETEISLDDFQKIAGFTQGLKDKIDKTSGVSLYTRSNRYFVPQKWMGYFFELHKFEDDKSVWGWVGTLYTRKGAVICVEFENRNGWGKLVCEKFQKIKSDLHFYLKDKNMTVDKFFEQVVNCVKTGNKNKIPDCITLNQNDAVNLEYLLAAKSLPWLMDKYFLAMANEKLVKYSKDNCKWELSSTCAEHNDSEVQGSHCGRYYTLHLNNQRYIEFWLGVYYNGPDAKFIFDISDVDYNRISSSENSNDWYKIEGWNSRVVHNIAFNEMRMPFTDVANSVMELLKVKILDECSVKI